MSRNQHSATPHTNLAEGVPLVGQPRYNLLCKYGHFEETSSPFQMVLPSRDGQPVALTVCRLCWVEFIGDEFEMRRISDEEASVLKAKFEAEQEARTFVKKTS